MKSKPPVAEADSRKSDVSPPVNSAALPAAVVPRNFRRVTRSRRFELCVVIMISPVALFRERTDVSLLFGDVCVEIPLLPSRDCRMDGFRDAQSISLSVQSDLTSKAVVDFFSLSALFDALGVAPQISCSSRARR